MNYKKYHIAFSCFASSLIFSFGSCEPERGEFLADRSISSNVTNQTQVLTCAPKEKHLHSSFQGEYRVREGVSWYWFNNDQNNGLKALYYQGAFSQDAQVALSRNGHFGSFVIDEIIDLGNGKAKFMIAQQRESFQDVLNTNQISENNVNGVDLRLEVIDCIDAFSLGESLSIEVIKR